MIRYIILACPFLVIYLVAYYSGCSLRGDHIDYSILGVSYLWLCLLLFSSNVYKSLILNVIRVVGYLLIGLMAVFSLITFPFSIYASQDFESDIKFHFTDLEKNKYEVRRYTYGGAMNSNTRYTFETYRLWGPLEKRIDVTDFFDDKTTLEVMDTMTFSISFSTNCYHLTFLDKHGKNYVKKIK